MDWFRGDDGLDKLSKAGSLTEGLSVADRTWIAFQIAEGTLPKDVDVERVTKRAEGRFDEVTQQGVTRTFGPGRFTSIDIAPDATEEESQ